jgi:hypothetical protein
MLEVQDKAGVWRPVEPDVLADAILRRRVRRASPARDAARSRREGRLEDLLGAEELKAVSVGLLAEVRGAMTGHDRALGFDALQRRLDQLRRWRFVQYSGRTVRRQVLWLSAWLAELLGRDAEAIKRYGEFIDDCTSRYRRDASSDIPTERLDAPLEQAELLILARNNRAVLRLRQGRLTWLDDLVEAALRDFLPGACLSLLNLVDMAWNRGRTDVVRPNLVRCLLRLDEKTRTHWLPGLRPQAAAVGAGGEPSSGAATEETIATALNDANAWRSLMFSLRGLAVYVATDEPDELQLWTAEPSLLVEGARFGSEAPGAWDRHRRYAEAVSLLYRRDVFALVSHPSGREEHMNRRIAALLRQARAALRRGRFATARRQGLVARTLLQRPGAAVGRELAAAVQNFDREVQAARVEHAQRKFWAVLQELERELHEIGGLGDPVEIGKRRAWINALLARLTRWQQRAELAGPPLDLAESFRDEIEQLRAQCFFQEASRLLAEKGPAAEDARPALARLFRAVLDWGSAADIEAMEAIVVEWRAMCAAWFDVRHPYHDMADALAAARLLAQAEQELRGDQSGLAESPQKAQAKVLVTEALGRGIRRGRQLLRAVRLYAVARPLAGPRSQQRATLSRVVQFVREEVLPLQPEETRGQRRDRLGATRVEQVEQWIAAQETPAQGGG